jgi:hypothetical protein
MNVLIKLLPRDILGETRGLRIPATGNPCVLKAG